MIPLTPADFRPDYPSREETGDACDGERVWLRVGPQLVNVWVIRTEDRLLMAWPGSDVGGVVGPEHRLYRWEDGPALMAEILAEVAR